MVAGEDAGKGRVAEKKGQEIIVAVFEDLAVDGGVLAALDEDEGGVPAVQVFDQKAMLLEVQLLESVGRDAVARGRAGLVAEDGGEKPEVRVTLCEDEVVAEGGQDGVVDRGGKGGDGSAGGETAEEGGVGDGLRLLDIGGEGLEGVEVEMRKVRVRASARRVRAQVAEVVQKVGWRW